MRIEENVSLAGMTTVGIGGVARRLYTPEGPEDLPLLPTGPDGTYRVISNGSNLLINDGREFDAVVSMRSYDAGIENLGGGRYRAGCSVGVGRLIKTINADGYGGIEELCSVPALLGGAVAMNASVPSAGVCVSDHLVEVEAFVGGRVVALPKGECAFGYRTSLFRDGRHLVLGAVFEFPAQDPGESERRRKARMEKVRATQDRGTRNFGSVFSESNGKIMQLARRAKLGSGGCRFSGKAGNWLVNEGGTFQDAMRAIRRVETLHRLAGKECVREVCVWE